MVNSCVVWGCTNRATGSDERSFYDIPKIVTNQGNDTEKLSRERRSLWLARINRQGFNPDPSKRHYKVCSDHFITGKKAALEDKTNPDWAPSLKMGSSREADSLSQSTLSLDRYRRANGRVEKRDRHSAARALLELQLAEHSLSSVTTDLHDDDDDITFVTDPAETSCKFFRTGSLERMPAQSTSSTSQPELKDEVQRLKKENEELRAKLSQRRFSPEFFRVNEDQAKHYTGLHYQTLMALFHFVSLSIPESRRTALGKFEKLILVLMKLRLNSSLQDIAYRFDISIGCASKVFSDVIHILYIKLKCLILWPDREQLQMTMPMEFRKHFGVKVSVVIDCFEVFIERPSNLLARAETWSNYKHHNTVKYLIGITPQGVVSYISHGYGGRATDKHITEHCGFLDNLLPGDIVLADRGFNISESVGLYCAEVKIPAFTRGKKQLSSLEIEATRKIAHSRIHVERVIGLVRNKYTLLRSTIPIDYLHCKSESVPTMDKIVTVCCALSNLCESIVSFD